MDDESSIGSVKRNETVSDKLFIRGECKALTARGISEETCKKYNYQIGQVPKDYPAKEGSTLHSFRGKTVQIENYYEDGQLVGQKLRDKDKNFAIIGKVKGLFGKRFVPAGQKLLVITEGAIDTLAYAEVRKNWPAVSIPNGAQSARKSLADEVEYLETFDKVVICFDNDEEGRRAAESVKGLLSPGKMFIGSLSSEYKDIGEAVEAGDVKAVLNAVLNADPVRPDGIIEVDDIMEEALKPIELGLPWFLDELTELTYGRRYGEVYGFGGGTGTGKTDLFTEQVAYDVSILKEPVGVLWLEQKPTETVKRIAGKIGRKRFHIPNAGWTNEDLIASVQPLRGKVTFYDSFGETEWEQIKIAIRHMHVSKGIKIFYIDHLTAMADTADEKGSLEQIMKEMAGLANELGLIIHYISHLTTPDGTPHEEGGRVMIRHFKGSRAIGFWSFFMFGLERNQQAEDLNERQTTILRVLKDRYTGQATGHVILLGYDEQTGKLYPLGQMAASAAQLLEDAKGF